MEQKTIIHAEAGRQDLTITRDFDLPVELLFRAHVEQEFLEQWMGTTILHLDSRKHGSYEFETRDPKGHVSFRAHGVFHELTPGQKLIRTFEMSGTPFGVQLEIYDFEKNGDANSRLSMHVIYETAAQRDEVLKLPFAQGLNWAHNRLQEVIAKMK